MSHDRDGWPVYLVLFPLEMGSPLLTQLMDEKSFCPPLSSALGYDNADGYKLANIINISIQSTTVPTIITTRLCRPRARKLDAISSYMRLLFLFSSSPPPLLSAFVFFSPCCSRRFGLGGGEVNRLLILPVRLTFPQTQTYAAARLLSLWRTSERPCPTDRSTSACPICLALALSYVWAHE